MRFINKTGSAAGGDELIDAILTESWDGEAYIGANYDALCKPEFRAHFLDILLAEQNNLCCYCLSEISINTITIEHIIPHKSTLQELIEYSATSVYFDSVIHAENFNRTELIIPPTRYPHDIAYYNLTGSCDSNSHCNHYRGRNFIRPLFYDDLINSKVLYDKNGFVFSEEYLDELQVLGLSTNRELIVFRAIWYKLAEQYTSQDDYSEEDLEEIILIMSLEDDSNQILNNLYDKPSLRDNFLLFKWFFQYYKDTILPSI